VKLLVILIRKDKQATIAMHAETRVHRPHEVHVAITLPTPFVLVVEIHDSLPE